MPCYQPFTTVSLAIIKTHTAIEMRIWSSRKGAPRSAKGCQVLGRDGAVVMVAAMAGDPGTGVISMIKSGRTSPFLIA